MERRTLIDIYFARCRVETLSLMHVFLRVCARMLEAVG